jgi:hypothetical protein
VPLDISLESQNPVGCVSIVVVTCMVRRRTARRIVYDENRLRKCIRPLVESDLRALDDDPRVPVLNNRRGRKRPCYDTGFQARRLTVFSSFLSSADSQEKNFRTPLPLVGNGQCSVPRVIVVPACHNCPTDPGQFVDSSNLHHIARRSGFQSPHPGSYTGALAFDT